MRTKKVVSVIAMIVFFVFVWFMQNKTLIGSLRFENLVVMNNSAFGYSSLIAYCVFFTVPYIIFFNLMTSTEYSFTIVRHKGRDALFHKTTTKIGLTSFLFSFLHTSINIILTVYFFKLDILLDNSQFFYGSLINLFGVALYFMVVGFIYKIFYELKNSISLATLITYLSIGLLYFLSKLFIPPNIWTPDKDLIILPMMLVNQLSSIELLLIFVRQMGQIFALYLIASTIYLRKDFLLNDSK